MNKSGEKFLVLCPQCEGTGSNRQGDSCKHCGGDGLVWRKMPHLPRKTRLRLWFYTLHEFVRQYVRRNYPYYSLRAIYGLFCEGIGYPEELRSPQ